MSDRPWLRIAGTVFSTRQARNLAAFCSRLRGWPMRRDEDGWVVVRPDDVSHGRSFHEDVECEPPVWPSRPGVQKMMVHLDIGTDDLDAAVTWAVECGATVAEHQPLHVVSDLRRSRCWPALGRVRRGGCGTRRCRRCA